MTTGLQLGLELKEEGMELAAGNRQRLLDTARKIAVEIAEKHGTVTADDVANELRTQGLGSLGPAAGSVFKDRRFKFTGRRVMSRQPKNHARELKVWELV